MSLGLRHAAKRRKAKESGFPTRRSMLKTALDIVILPVAALAPIALVPQVVQLYVTQDASSLSLPTWSTLVVLNVIWLYYGLVHKEKPIIITNAMLAVINFSMALGVVLFG